MNKMIKYFPFTYSAQGGMRSSPDPGLNGTQVFSNTGPLAGPGEIRILRCLGIDWKQEKKG
jgi:hypothetical protein